MQIEAEPVLNPASLIDPRTPAPAPGEPRPRVLRALTGVRFFAALHVALYHFVRPFSQWGHFGPFMAAGYTGVPFFFLLSGYILTYSHARERDLGRAFQKRFLFARFARIYPVYLLLLLFAAIIGRSVFIKRIHILAFFAHLLMVQTWSLRMVNFFNIPAWSLSVEIFFYAVFPFVFFRLIPSTRARAVLWSLLFWALAMVFPLVCLHYDPAGFWSEGGGLLVFRALRFPPTLLPEFLAGIPLAWLFLRFRPSPAAANILALTGFAGVFIALYFANHLPFLPLQDGLLIPFYGMILLGLSEDTWIARLFSNAPLVLLGEASYAFYLIHFLFNDTTRQWFQHDALSAVPAKLVVVIALSIAAHLLIERPCRKVLLQWWNRRHPKPPVPASQAHPA